jgi:hypothetical protein
VRLRSRDSRELVARISIRSLWLLTEIGSNQSDVIWSIEINSGPILRSELFSESSWPHVRLFGYSLLSIPKQFFDICKTRSIQPPWSFGEDLQLFWNLHSRLESLVPEFLDYSMWIGDPSETFWMHHDRDDRRLTPITESHKVITRPCSRFPGLLFGEYLGHVNIPFEYIL